MDPHCPDAAIIGRAADNLDIRPQQDRPVKISATLQPLLDTARRDASSLLKQLQVGQTLPARVLAELQPGLVRLQLATIELLARSQVRLPAGTELRLEVVKGQPLPELRILRNPEPQALRQLAVRSALARELPAPEVRQAATALRPLAQTPRQVDVLRQFASILQDSGLRVQQLNPGQLQRAVALSGLFHEARLAAGAPVEPGDTKTRLLQLLALLGGTSGQGRPPVPHPPDAETGAQAQRQGEDSLLGRLIRLIEGSVARIQLQQSAALPSDEPQRQAWQIDLPIHLPEGTDDVTLRIEREARRDAADAVPEWSVNLAFRFDTIGDLECRITLAGERVATTFWCEQPVTQSRVEQSLPNLKDALEAQGLEVVHLAGVVGDPPEPLSRVPVPQNLLDERA